MLNGLEVMCVCAGLQWHYYHITWRGTFFSPKKKKKKKGSMNTICTSKGLCLHWTRSTNRSKYCLFTDFPENDFILHHENLNIHGISCTSDVFVMSNITGGEKFFLHLFYLDVHSCLDYELVFWKEFENATFYRL